MFHLHENFWKLILVWKCIGTRGNGLPVMIDEEGFVLSLLKAKEVEYPKPSLLVFH